MKLSGWGRYPVIEAHVHAPRTVDALRELVLKEPSLIARGNGRAYGDSAINPTATIETRHLDRMIAFDPASGQLVTEAGVQLGEIITSFLPRGWFPFVTPGTKFVTVGGAIAADVHGKNHHKEGSFRACVDWIDVLGRDGEVRRCSASQEGCLFDHTIGGMGLTGIILRAAIRLRPVETGWIRQTTIAAPDLKAAIAAFESAQDTTYSVAWIDCLGTGARMGRSLVMLGEHARHSELSGRQTREPFPREKRGKWTVPIDGPGFALNGFTVGAFSSLYYWAGKRKTGEQLVDWDSYFYPWTQSSAGTGSTAGGALRSSNAPFRLARPNPGSKRFLPKSPRTARAHFWPYSSVSESRRAPSPFRWRGTPWRSTSPSSPAFSPCLSAWTPSPSPMAAGSIWRRTAG